YGGWDAAERPQDDQVRDLPAERRRKEQPHSRRREYAAGAEREGDAGEQQRDRGESARARALAEDGPRRDERVRRLDLEAEHGLDRGRAACALEEEPERCAGAERADENQPRADAWGDEQRQLAAQRQYGERRDAGAERRRRGDEERVGAIRGELGDRRDERAVQGAQRGEDEPG